MSGSKWQTGMRTDRRVELRVVCAQDDRHCSPGRHPCNEDPPLIDTIGRGNFTVIPAISDGFAGIPSLIFRSKPVPAPRSVRARSLSRIDDEETVSICPGVHAGAGSEVVRRLRCNRESITTIETASLDPIE